MTNRVLVALTAVLLLVAPHRQLGAQSAERAFNLFLDCQDLYCEPDYYRTELAFVNHVRERTAADVHVLVTRESTGGGGRHYSLAFYGQNRFAGLTDTLSMNTPQGATEDEQRQALLKSIRLGLVRYLARTPEGARVSVSLEAPKTIAGTAAPARDPWNAWVFRVGTNMNGNREEGFQSAFINGNVRASRITERWKTSLRVDEFYSEQKFDFEGEKIATIRRDFGGNASQVRSITDHWSAGIRAGASSSTFLNQHLAASIAPALEFDFYPYKESTRRQLIAQYSAGVRRYVYNDTTIYFKLRETKPFESLALNYAQKQTWGSVDVGANGYHFLDDLTKNRLNLSAEIDVRILKGLSLTSFINYAVLHDQLYLAKGNLSKDEVLLRQSQLQTGYRAFYYISLNYTFGSVLNNVVNPRFNTGGGGDF